MKFKALITDLGTSRLKNNNDVWIWNYFAIENGIKKPIDK